MRIEGNDFRSRPLFDRGGLSRRPPAACVSAFVVAIGLCSGLQVVAQEPAAENAAREALPEDARVRNGKICQYEDVTGSRMRKRVCYTAARWEARERNAQALVRELESKSVSSSEE